MYGRGGHCVISMGGWPASDSTMGVLERFRPSQEGMMYEASLASDR